MSWILNRAGQQHQEGPYEEGYVLQLIQSGQLREGFVSVPGSNQWIELAEHPPFAHALGVPVKQRRSGGTLVMQAGDAAPNARPEGAQWNAGPSPGAHAPHHVNPSPAMTPGAAGFGGPAPGAPPPGWGGAAQGMPPTLPEQPKPRKEKGGLGLIIGGAVAVVGLVVTGALALVLLTGAGSKASQFVPDDVLAFVEFPDSAVALKNALGVDFLDPSKVDAGKQLEQAIKGLTTSFGLDKSQAEDLLLGIEGMAVTLRKEAGREQIAVLLTFRNESVIKPWLGSERVTKEGKFGSSGERYFVARAKDVPASDAPAAIQALSGMSIAKDDDSQALVWFPDKSVLCMGHVDLLDDIDSVITKGDGALADSERFQSVDFSGDAVLLGYLSPDVLDEVKDEAGRKWIQGYLDGIAPFTLEASFDDAGILTRLRGQLRGSRISEEEGLPGAIDLQLPKRFPTATVAYVAVGSERAEDGKALRSRLVKQVRASDEGAAEELEAALGQLESSAGVSFERLIDAIGNELALGMVADPAFELGPEAPLMEQLDKLAAVLLVQVGSEEAASDVVKQARTKLFEDGPLKASYVIKQQGLGFQGLPNDPKLPTVQVFFHEGRLLVGVGGKQVLAKALLALGGKDSLASDEAHEKAMKSLGAEPRLLVWVDGGRLGKSQLDALPEATRNEFDQVEKELGISRAAVKLEGPDRVTAAAALFAESKGDTWTYAVETLNAPAFGVLGVVGPLLNPPAPGLPPPDPLAPPIPTTPPIPGLFLPQTGVPQCDGLAILMFQCGQRTADAALSEQARALETRLKTELAADPTRAGAAGNQCSQDLLTFLRDNPQCSGS